jgi:type IV secretion system protein VirB5
MKPHSTALLGAAALFAAVPAHAQMAVYDATSYAKILEQARTATRQLDELRSQVQQGQQLLSSLNTNSNVNAIASQLASPALRQFLPDISQYVAMAKGDFSTLGPLGGRAAQIRAAARLYTPQTGASQSEADKFYTDALEQSGDRVARDLALGESVGDASAQRLHGLEQLRTSLGSAGDARAVLDIQARIAAETALIQNDQMRLQGIEMVQQAQERMKVQRSEELARKNHEEAEAFFRSSIQ